IDDYSPKDFYNQVELYIEKLNDKRIHLIRCKKNRGPGYCRNVGIKYAYKNKSPIILYNDSDDISDSNRLKVVRKIFVSEEEVDVVYSTFIPINERDEVIEYDKLGPALKSILDGNNDNPISERNSLIRLGTEKNYTNVTSSTAVRTELAYNNLFPKYRVSEDAHTWYRYAANGGFFYYSPNIPTKYRIKSDGKSTTRIKQDSFCEKKIKAYSSGFKKAISIYSQKNFLTKNEKTKILHDFCLCLYKTIEREASKKTLLKVERKIKKYSDFLDINIFDKEKHVLQIIVPQKEGRVGGSDTHVLALSNTQQVKSAFSPIILFTKNNEYLEKIKKMDISYIYTGNCKNKIKMLRLLSDIPKKYNIEIIHSHQYNANYLAVIIKLILYKNWHNIPLVMTCHGWIENNFKDRFYTFWDFFTYLFARALICVSKKDILRLNHTIFKRKKKYYIPNGVLIAKNGFKQNKIILEKHNIPEKKIIISYVGRLAPEKRLDLVIKIAEIVCKKIDN
ncbi:MAG TPA: glycosyltransferase, partial [Gallicola sp.]|nr:glycosyltransferase [Gallicola sp.]